MASSTSAVVTRANRGQFNSMFSNVWAVLATGYDPASAADGAGVSTTFTIPGVALGDMILAFSISLDNVDVMFTAAVTAADTVVVRLQNESTATLDLASCTARFLIGRPDPSFFNNATGS